jgi:hypothetical protein
MPPQVEKAIYSTNQAIKYVGSKQFFHDLLIAFPQILSPIRVCKSTGKNSKGQPRKGKTEYLKADIDTALKAAKLSRQFVEKD